jgi:hypothetical protein
MNAMLILLFIGESTEIKDKSAIRGLIFIKT